MASSCAAEQQDPGRTPPEGAPSGAAPAANRPDTLIGLRLFLFLDLFVRLFIWGWALILTVVTFAALGGWPRQAFPAATDFYGVSAWVWAATRFIILFNVFYVLVLLVLRLMTPTPREGRYSTVTRVPHRQVLYACLIAVLTKARLQAPFPGFLVFHVANLPPLVWLMSPLFGPRSRSCYVTDPNILDPHLVTLGRNVVIGFNATVAGHYQVQDDVVFARTVIEDDVLIGAYAAVAGGVRIGRGATVNAGAIVVPGSVIAPGETWHGNPARRVRAPKTATSSPTTEEGAPS